MVWECASLVSAEHTKCILSGVQDALCWVGHISGIVEGEKQGLSGSGGLGGSRRLSGSGG